MVSVTANKSAWLLAEALNTSPEFSLNLQTTHVLSVNRHGNPVQPLVATGI